ncbi:MAG: hypothetical protein L0K65_07225, partial [Actinomyces sp.]|nr:hypothetical protein [Actinomyces sp.]
GERGERSTLSVSLHASDPTAFTTAVFLVFNTDFGLVEAHEVDASDIEQTRHVAHVNGKSADLRWVRSVSTDVTAEMRAAWISLNETPA